MPTNVPQEGLQLSVDIIDAPLNLASELAEGRQLAAEIIKQMPAKVIKAVEHQFDASQYPAGYTFCYLLDSSHLAIHTYSETRTVLIDAFCCAPATRTWTEDVEELIRKRYSAAEIRVTVNLRRFR